MKQEEKDGIITVTVSMDEMIDDMLIGQIYIHTGKLLTREELNEWREKQDKERTFGHSFLPTLKESKDTFTITIKCDLNKLFGDEEK